MKILFTSIAALALTGTVALAQDGSAWDGAYGGVTASSHSPTCCMTTAGPLILTAIPSA